MTTLLKTQHTDTTHVMVIYYIVSTKTTKPDGAVPVPLWAIAYSLQMTKTKSHNSIKLCTE